MNLPLRPYEFSAVHSLGTTGLDQCGLHLLSPIQIFSGCQKDGKKGEKL